MGRRKKEPEQTIEKEFPFLPVPLADAILYAEEEIRRAVKEERESLSFIKGRDMNGGGRSGQLADGTAAAAVKLADGLPFVKLSDGRLLEKPEKWLAVIDAVRQRAESIRENRWPVNVLHGDDIIYEWDAKYLYHQGHIDEGKGGCSPLWTISGRIISWIRFNILIGARDAGLVSFNDAELQKEVEAAAG